MSTKTEISKNFLYFYHEIEIFQKKILYSLIKEIMVHAIEKNFFFYIQTKEKFWSTLSKKIRKLWYSLKTRNSSTPREKNLKMPLYLPKQKFLKMLYIHLKHKFLKYFYIYLKQEFLKHSFKYLYGRTIFPSKLIR